MKFHLVSMSNNQTHVLARTASGALRLAHFIQWYVHYAVQQERTFLLDIFHLTDLSGNISHSNEFETNFDNVK